jgi:hypothetical protein
MNSNGNDNGGTASPETMLLFRETVRDCATIMERSRCLGLIRQACEAAAVGATTVEEIDGVAALQKTLHMLIVHPNVEARHPMPAREPRSSAHADPVLLDKLVTALTEALRVRRGQLLTDELIIERARNAAVYVAEVIDEQDEPAQPGVQVTVRDTASAPKGTN